MAVILNDPCATRRRHRNVPTQRERGGAFNIPVAPGFVPRPRCGLGGLLPRALPPRTSAILKAEACPQTTHQMPRQRLRSILNPARYLAVAVPARPKVCSVTGSANASLEFSMQTQVPEFDPRRVFHWGYVAPNMDRAVKQWTTIGAELIVPAAHDPIQNVLCSLLVFRGAAPIGLVAAIRSNPRFSSIPQSHCSQSTIRLGAASPLTIFQTGF